MDTTDATLGFDEVHVTAGAVAFDGVTVAVKRMVDGADGGPSTSATFGGTLMDVTGINGFETTTITTALRVLDDIEVTVITALPTPRAVSKPEVETDATLVFDDDQVTAVFVAFDGVRMAAKTSVA